MAGHTTIPLDDPEALAREVQALREEIAELQRRMARYDDAGESRQMSGLAVSMSEREELLVEAERIAHMGSWVWDVETASVSWSDELYRILGYHPERERPSVERYFAAIHPDDLPRVQEASRQAAESGLSRQLHYRVRRPDGTVRHVLTHGASLFDAGGKLRRIVGTILDVTESREAALKLEHALHLLEEAQRFARLGSWTHEISGALTWSRELFHILGLPPDTAPSKELFLQQVHPDDLPIVRCHVGAHSEGETLERGGTPHSEEPIDARVVRPDGELRYLRLRARFEHGEDGQVVCLRGVVQDVTDATLLQRRLARAEKMETIGRLAGGIAHEFNNILTVIHAGAELMNGAQADPQIIEQTKQSVVSARELTSRLLAFGRQSTLRPQRVDPNQIVRDTVRLVERILGEHVTLEMVLDPHLTGQALVNLLINARDAMPQGGKITVSTRRVDYPGGPAGPLVELAVRDTGPGIAPDLRDKIFEPFFTTKHEGHGTGLGLAMVQGAVEQQGGSVTFESGPHGTLFLLRFPTLGERSAPPTRALPMVSDAGERRLRILVVEDQESLAHMVERLLMRAGHEVSVCVLPSQAIELYRARANELDLIISDVLMPEMSGMELVERLAALAPLPRLVFMSGYGAEAARTLGYDRIVLAKPFTYVELLAAIERAFET